MSTSDDPYLTYLESQLGTDPALAGLVRDMDDDGELVVPFGTDRTDGPGPAAEAWRNSQAVWDRFSFARQMGQSPLDKRTSISPKAAPKGADRPNASKARPLPMATAPTRAAAFACRCGACPFCLSVSPLGNSRGSLYHETSELGKRFEESQDYCLITWKDIVIIYSMVVGILVWAILGSIF